MQAINDYVVLDYQEKERKKGGIVLSDVSKSKQATAKVVAVGDKVEKIKKGDEVLFDPFSVREVTVEGKKLYIIRAQYIYCIL